MGRIIGIDLGTTNSLVTVWEGNESRLIPNALGEYLTPSVVSIDAEGTVYVGAVAKERLVTHPQNTVSLFKRFMGTSKIYRLGGKKYRAEELSSLILRRLKEDAETYLGEPVEEAVISVPAYFNDMARKATRDAGRLAGLVVEKIINEPSAAALACQQESETEALYLVFDFGGGTLDVSLVDCFENIIEIRAVSGDNSLGGSDFDRVIAEEFCKENDLVFRETDPELAGVILASAEEAKKSLTKQEETIMRVKMGTFEGVMELSRMGLIKIADELFQRMSRPLKKVLVDTQTSLEQIDMVVLVGGSCKMPIVQQYLQYILKDVKIITSRPDYMVAAGTGVYAGIRARDEEVKDLMLTDICPFSLGLATYNETNPQDDFMSVMIERNSPLPISIMHTFYTVSDRQKEILIEVYQGEELYVRNNLPLGSVNIQVPPAAKEKSSVQVRFTYDINGLLVVDVEEPITGAKKQLVIVNKQNNMSQKEMAEKLQALEKLKIHPRESEENRFLLEWGEKLFAQSSEAWRSEIKARIDYFEHLLDRQDTYRIEKWKRYLKAFLSEMEGYYQQIGMAWQREQSFGEWYENPEEEKDELEEYTEWVGNKYLN